MKKIIFSLFLFFIVHTSYAQLEDILKKIPGVGTVFQEAVTTSIKDAYPTAYWLGDLDKKINVETDRQFNTNLEGGYYKFRFNTFCLHAGAYAPTEGDGYLVAPLKGAKSGLIKNILSRSADHPEINQSDVQLLVWGVEANQKFTDYPADFQLRVQPLVTAEDIAKMEVDLNKVVYDLLPSDVQNIINYYGELRGKLSDVNSTYEDIEKVAVKTGIAPLGKGSKNIEAGTWTSIGDRVYMRVFPENYKKSNIEIYIPAEVKIDKDSKGNITVMDNGSYRIEYTYDGNSTNFNTAIIKNLSTNETAAVENNLTDNSTVNKVSEDFISLVKKSFSKKKKERLTGESVKTLSRLKMLETTLGSLIEKKGWTQDAYSVSVNAVNSFVSGIETGNKKGGGKTHVTGLGNVSGLVYAPGNTSSQRLGSGGPEGGNGNGDPNKHNPPPPPEKDCKVKVFMSQVGENELPEPDHVYTVTINISIDGTDADCNAEEINFELFDVSKERGRCLNDLEQYDDVDEDLQMSDLNQGYNLSKLTAQKQISGKSQSQQIYVLCRDWGAYGKLKCSVKVKGTWYEAEGDGTPDKFVNIPLDLNSNHIADYWEKQNGVYGKPAEWDEDPNPTGQARDGDGITNYEEFRGFFVSDGNGGKEHVRTDPNQKEIFVIDNDQIFSISSWKAASGIKAYWLTTDMVYGSKGGGELDLNYRWVDFCRGYAQGNKFAVHLKKIIGMDDPYHLCSSNLNYDGCDQGSPVKNAVLTIVLPDRTKQWLIDTKDTLSAWLAKSPNAPSMLIGGQTFSTMSIKNFVNAINNPAKFDEVMNFYINLTALHEVGHALGVLHHGGGDPTKTTTGDHGCPMRYLEDMDPVYINSAWLKSVLDLIDKGGNVIVIYTKWRFCKTGDNCWKQLDANDR